ncbi:MAG TPA: hypothetical protein VGK76_08820 [Candidatus Eisenbacteria bacterium]|jgi:hypothetical protein
MYRRILVVAAALLSLFCVGSPSFADNGPAAEHPNVALGFHDTSAPLGVRWWLASQKVGIDLGLGFHSDDAASSGFPDDKLTGWAIDAGVPIVVKSWPRVHVLFRPGILYRSQQVEDPSTPLVFDTENQKDFFVTGELEGEGFILENFSVSASTGIAYESFDPAFGADKETFFTTLGNNFTEVGFHLYLFH